MVAGHQGERPRACRWAFQKVLCRAHKTIHYQATHSNALVEQAACL